MTDNLAIINKIIEEHHSIRGHVKLVGDSVSDIEALFGLRRAHSVWSQSSLETLSEKRRQLQQAISFLDEGLRNHFSFEEKALPPLLGELLMRALVLQHRKIRAEIDTAKTTVTDTKLEELSQEELLSKRSQIQQRISHICQIIEEHAAEEETILKMMREALQD
jgi:hemerythrin superfamily protein